jgi:hypothetical protein
MRLRCSLLGGYEPRPPAEFIVGQSCYPWLVVATTCIAAFIGQLDASIVQRPERLGRLRQVRRHAALMQPCPRTSPLTPAIVPRTRSGAATALLAASAQPAAMASTRKRRYIVSSLKLEEGHATHYRQTPGLVVISAKKG